MYSCCYKIEDPNLITRGITPLHFNNRTKNNSLESLGLRSNEWLKNFKFVGPELTQSATHNVDI